VLSGSAAGGVTSYVWEPFDYLRAGLGALEKKLPAAVLAESETILVGSKDFLPPSGLGRMESTRCYLIVLRKGRVHDFSRFFKKASAMAPGPPVWRWSADLGEFGDRDARSSSLYATQIVQSYILVSNSLEELKGVSAQLSSSDNDARVIQGIHEWNAFNAREFWGYRQFKHGEPRATDRVFFGNSDPIGAEADALILYVDVKKQTGLLRLVSSTSDDTTAKNINATRRITPLKRMVPKVWEAVFPLDEVGQFPESASWVLWLFGCGVLVSTGNGQARGHRMKRSRAEQHREQALPQA
jgi:hypothetical protein